MAVRSDSPEMNLVPPILPEQGKLSEFRFNEPLPIPGPTPISLFDATLASTFLLVDDPGDRVWVNAAVSWYADFTAVNQQVDVTFYIERDGIALYAVAQSLGTPVAPTPPATTVRVQNGVRLQFVDQPLSALTTPELRPVVYSLRAYSDSPLTFTLGPVTLGAAEIEPNLLSPALS